MLRRIGIGYFLSLTALPLFLGLGYALLYSLGLLGVLGKGFTTSYWVNVFAEKEIWWSLAFSSYIALMAMIFGVGVALILVINLRNEFRKGILSYVIYFPLAIPAMVAAFFSFQFLGKAGFLSRFCTAIGLTDSIQQFPDLINDWLGVGIIFSHVLLAIPFLLLLFVNTYDSERLEELSVLSNTLGANKGQIRRMVVIPVLLRKNFPSLILYFIFVLGSYEIPLLLGRESPQMVSVLTIRKLQRFDLMDKPEAYIIAIVYTVFVLSAMVAVLRRRVQS